MSDMDAVFAALAVLAKQCREQGAEIADLKSLVRLHEERLDAQGMMLASPTRREALRHYAAMARQAREEAA